MQRGEGTRCTSGGSRGGPGALDRGISLPPASTPRRTDNKGTEAPQILRFHFHFKALVGVGWGNGQRPREVGGPVGGRPGNPRGSWEGLL